MKLYQNPSKFDNAAFIPDILSESENPNKVTGINIIAFEYGMNVYGFELDKEFYDLASKRLEHSVSKLTTSLF